MDKTFSSIASDVLKESISTAMFIDDKALEPFEKNKPGREDFTDLYKSFKKYNCLLDIRRYKNIGNKRKFKQSLSKIDLLVLDWQLVESDIKHLTTLHMLASAISSKNIHFICIYSRRKNEEIEDLILYPIISYFSSEYKEKAKERLDNFYEILDNQGIELQDFKDRIYGLLKEVTFLYHQELDPSNGIKDIENVLQELKVAVEFINFVETNYDESDCVQKLIHFGYEIFDGPASNTVYPIRISKINRNSLYINNTVIIIRNKVDTPDLYGNLRDSLIDDHNIFFTLFGLEMRNRFRESSAFIGTEISSIDEISLFYHQNQVNSFEFIELLKNIWKEQTSSFLYEKNIKILDALEDYKSKRKIRQKVTNYSKKDTKNQENLAKINTFYNTLDIIRIKADKIKFGDIFYRNGEVAKKYILCITPHCDCLRPEKIDYMFHFIEGEEDNLSAGLKKAEEGFFSFINFKSRPICIKWNCKPFSIHIPLSKNRIPVIKKVYVKGEKVTLSYLDTLRENYCQRIANRSFGNPLRVGITFAKTKD